MNPLDTGHVAGDTDAAYDRRRLDELERLAAGLDDELARTGQVLEAIDGIPIANTKAAEYALLEQRVRVLERFHAVVAELVVADPDPATEPQRVELGDDDPTA